MPAKVKIFEKQGKDKLESKKTSSLYGGTFNFGFFQYEGCNYCDDIIGETSDLSVGDAWLPEYVEDEYGMSLCVSRNKIITQILSSQKLETTQLDPKDVITAQEGGIDSEEMDCLIGYQGIQKLDCKNALIYFQKRYQKPEKRFMKLVTN